MVGGDWPGSRRGNDVPTRGRQHQQRIAALKA